MKSANAPCGSWYFFGGQTTTLHQTRVLAHYWQEIAIHVEDPGIEPVVGLGVTHHSAPTSMYWRGDRTNAVLEERGARYCEFLNVQTGYPRPAWIRDRDGTRRMGRCWTTPVHFPLEGSTSDTDLRYFDQRSDRFRELVAAGGHCIIGTHPDLNQKLMELVLAREDVSDIWFDSVDNVVERCRKVMAHGAIRSVASPDGGVALLSGESLADLQVEIREAGSVDVKRLTLQLEGGRARSLDLAAD